MESKNLNKSKKSKNQDNESFFKFDVLSLVFLVISLILILLGILGPFFFHQQVSIRDIFFELRGGLITVAGIILTFLAFYIQYKANESQKTNLKAEKLLNEKKNIENRIYDLVKIHHENVSHISVDIIDLNDFKSKSNNYYHTITGREAFKSLIDEYCLIFYFLSNKNPKVKDIDKSTFEFFYQGIYYQKFVKFNFEEYYKDLIKIKDNINKHYYIKNEKIFEKYLKQNSILRINKNLFENLEQKLSTYFKHFLFLVDYIYSQDEEILNKKDKEFYFSFVNSQLSSYEQYLLKYFFESKINTQYSFDLNELNLLQDTLNNDIKDIYNKELECIL